MVGKYARSTAIKIWQYRIVCLSLAASVAFGSTTAFAQQRANSDFKAEVENPRFAQGKGPIVAIDEAHENFHTLAGRYAPFADVLKADGFQLTANKEPFSAQSLAQFKVLVIANALHPDNQGSWQLPTPSAFTDEEIDALDEWIQAGGSLFLIADHMPFPGAAAKLAKRLQIEMINGFAFEHEPDRPSAIKRGATVFRRDNDSILSHAITEGGDENERVNQVASFTGQAFRANENAHPILRLVNPTVVLAPQTAWQFAENTESIEATGLLQGVAIEHGEGRVVVFGEAAMFTSQRQGNAQATSGMTAELAKDNQKLLLNIIRWLARSMD